MKNIMALAACLISFAASADCFTVNPDWNCNGPTWTRYCSPRWWLNLACTEDMYNAVYTEIPATISATTVIPAYMPQQMGTSPATITGAFASILASNIANNAANLDSQILNGVELLPRMSTELRAYDQIGATQQILITAAQYASATSLQYLAAVFGPAAVDAAMPYAPVATQVAYYSLPTPAPLPFSAYYFALQGTTSPLTGGASYLMDVWLETYFLGSDSVLTAQHKTQQYAMSVLGTGSLEVILLENPAAGAGMAARMGAVSRIKPNAEPPYGGPVLFWATVAVQVAQLVDPNLGAQIDGALYAISVGAITDGFTSANTYGWTMSPWGNTVVTDPYSQPFPAQEDGDNAYPMSGNGLFY